MTQLRKPQAGFTLTELAIVLGVIGLILGAIWIAASNVAAQNRNNQAVRQITTIVANVRAAYGTRGSFIQTVKTDMTTNFVTANIFPPELLTTAGVPVNAWGGNVKVYVINSTTFRVSYYMLPVSACIGIAQQLIGNSSSSSNPQNLYTDSSTTPLGLTGGVTPAAIIAACGANPATPTTTSSVEFDFNVR